MGVRLTAVTKSLPSMGSGVTAVIVGYIASVAMMLVFFAIFASTMPSAFADHGQEPTLFVLVLTLAISVVSAVAGGIVIAAMTRYSRQAYAVILGSIMIAMRIVTMILEQGAKPLWWHLTMFALIIPCTMLGASMVRRS